MEINVGSENMEIDHGSRQQEWSVGLCDCGEDILICSTTYFAPFITFGQIAEMLDEGRSSCVGQGIWYGVLLACQCHWIYSWTYRRKLRAKFGLPNRPVHDCCVHFFCEPCALCQEHAELKTRGFDASRGWIGPPNIVPPNATPLMPPTMDRWND